MSYKTCHTKIPTCIVCLKVHNHEPTTVAPKFTWDIFEKYLKANLKIENYNLEVCTKVIDTHGRAVSAY